MKLAWFVSHPIQYQVPLFAAIEKSDVDLTVFYYSRFGVEPSFDIQFGKTVKWDIPLLSGYRHVFLRNAALREGFHFWGFVNFSIWNELPSGRFDAVVLNGWSYASDWLAVVSSALRGIPVLLRSEMPLNQEMLKSPAKRILKKIVLGKILFPLISGFLYIGEENRKFYRYYGAPDRRLFFVPYAVDNERFMLAYKESRSRKHELMKTPGMRKEDIVILFVGKLISKKRPMDLLLAYERLTAYGLRQNPALLFVGEGELRPSLEGFAREKNLKDVYFAGFKNQTEIPAFYAAADVFVLPSGEGETWGVVVNEAMCFGLPIVLSHRVGSAADLVRNGQNGYIFRMGDIGSLTESLLLLVSNPARRKQMGERSSEIVKEYSLLKDVEGLRTALRSL